MSAKQFPDFYRLHGMIRLNNLPEPEPVLIKMLPVDSAIHYLGNNDNPEIDVSDPLMLGYTERVRYMNIVQYPAGITGGRRNVWDMSPITTKFDKLNRGFKVAKTFADLKAVTSKQLVVFNYGYLDESYRWPAQATTRFLQFENKLATLVDTIDKMQEINSRNHFVVLDVPSNLLPKTILDNNVTKPDLKLANIFTGPDEQVLRHFWMLLNPAISSRSIWSKFSDETKKKVNFIFKSYDGKYTVINLGYLYSWVRGNPNLTFMKMVDVKSSNDVQKYFLRGNIVMQTINQTGSSMKAQEDAQREKAKLAEEQAKLDEEASEKDERFLQDQEYEASAIRDQSGIEYASKVIGADGTRTPKEVQAIQQKLIKEQDLQVEPEINEEDVDGDLDALEKIYIQRLKATSSRPKPVEINELKASEVQDIIPEDIYTSEVPETIEQIKSEIFTPTTPEQTLLIKLERMAEDGRITATEFRKKAEMIKQASKLPDPYGSGKTIEEASKITEEELIVTKQETALNVPSTVIDKSMAHASLSVMAQKYNTKTIYKDILNCIQAAQKGGVIIKNHQVDIRPSIMGDVEVHTVEITPLNGQPSIVRAMLPVVNEDGEFVARNTKYVFRKGVVDKK